MGNFNIPNTYRRDSKAEDKKPWGFLQHGEKFLTKMIGKPIGRCALLHLILTNKEEL